MAAATPLILCGKTLQIASGVKAGLLPEYEVVHVILSVAAGVAEIPKILRGEKPADSEENAGTRNYSDKPAAVVVGAGYGDADVAQMRDACVGGSSVPWLRPDMTVPTPPLGPEYGKHMVGRVKQRLNQLKETQELNGDKVVMF